MVKGKVALVTGAASGLGAATAKLLAEEGASVLITDIDEAGGQAATDKLAATGADVAFLAHDVSDEAQWQTVTEFVRSRWGRLDILVNNAGIAMFALVTDLTLADWRKCMAVDLDGVFLGTKWALPIMRESGGGSIVNISSMAGMVGFANLSAYCAAKGGVRLFTKAVALECAALGDGVRVNSIHPGIIATPIFDDVDADAGLTVGRLGDDKIDIAELASRSVPMKVPGKPEDVARAVLYLASDASAYVTGTELVIDGGVCAG